jgi:hypothetical protein
VQDGMDTLIRIKRNRGRGTVLLSNVEWNGNCGIGILLFNDDDENESILS